MTIIFWLFQAYFSFSDIWKHFWAIFYFFAFFDHFRLFSTIFGYFWKCSSGHSAKAGRTMSGKELVNMQSCMYPPHAIRYGHTNWLLTLLDSKKHNLWWMSQLRLKEYTLLREKHVKSHDGIGIHRYIHTNKNRPSVVGLLSCGAAQYDNIIRIPVPHIISLWAEICQKQFIHGYCFLAVSKYNKNFF